MDATNTDDLAYDMDSLALAYDCNGPLADLHLRPMPNQRFNLKSRNGTTTDCSRQRGRERLALIYREVLPCFTELSLNVRYR